MDSHPAAGQLVGRETELAQLELTPGVQKTVETHIRNIFHKLGASSRVEVARIVERERRERDASAEPA